MATVFAAVDERMGRDVAIKVLHPDLAAALGAERFQREIQIAGHLTHPHILALYDSGSADGLLYYVMPFVKGESLRHRLDRDRQLGIDEALRISIEVASALDYAHRQGVVHRDIKPENILLEEGHAVVADFGIARAMGKMAEESRLTQTGMTLGTAAYMSPEQGAAEKDLDGRADLYSLACVTYEMLAGQPPFTGPNSASIAARHALDTPPSLTIMRRTVPDEVEEVVFQALAKAPVDRYESAADYAEALESCLMRVATTTRRTIAARPTETTAARRRYRKRRRFALVTGSIVIALAAGWGVWSVASGRPQHGSLAVGRLDPHNVAVLYFEDLSGDRHLRYLADALTEGLIKDLVSVRALDVVSANGVAPFRDAALSTDSIATVLGSGTILKGTVEGVGEQVSVVIRLFDGNTGADVDRKNFTLPAKNPLALRDSVVGTVASLLRERVGEEVRLRRQRQGTGNVAAWTLVQRAMKARHDAEGGATSADTTRATSGFHEADSLLVEASSLDAGWSEPQQQRADLALSRALVSGDRIAAAPWIDSGFVLVSRVLSTDPKDPIALETRGRLHYRRWELQLARNPREAAATLDSAEQDLKAATDLDPTRANAWSVLSAVYNQKDKFVEAKLAARRAYEEDAYLAGADRVLWRLYATSYDLEQFAEAKQWCEVGRRRFAKSPQFVRCRLWLQTARSVAPDPADAWQALGMLQGLVPAARWPLQQREAQMLVAAALARGGAKDSARSVLLRARAGPDVDPQGQLLTVEAFVRTLFDDKTDTDEAFSLLRRYLSSNPAHRAGFVENQSWWWRELKRDPRYKELAAGTSS
jgi:serine/threonine-protein kinase